MGAPILWQNFFHDFLMLPKIWDYWLNYWCFIVCISIRMAIGNIGKYKKNPIFWFWFGLKHIMKLILIKYTHLIILISKFKTLIQLWKCEKKPQNKKSGYGIEVFPKNKILLFHIPKNSMFYHNPTIIPFFPKLII